MFTYKKAPYKIFALGPKFCWAVPDKEPPEQTKHYPLILKLTQYTYLHSSSSSSGY